ncbi:MAG TPA: hypothetical protein VFD99_00990 [Arthrobacter sp.]|jgi:uncharacterized protein YigA (DUF484 family)|nr:hypothetical protein [Arthrobacter sp.]
MSTATHPVHRSAHADTSRHEREATVEDEDEREMQIAAAQLRLVTDRRLGKPTPKWVKDLAAEQPRSHAS